MSGKVLITGGYGNLGSWLTRHFAKQGFDVYVLSRQEKFKLEGLAYTVIEADISNLEELKSKIIMSFDFCIHTASLNEHFLENYAKDALMINALGTRNILEVLTRNGIKKFIYMSTFHVYGANSGYITEESPLLPKNDYASTHLFAEYYLKQFSFTCKLEYTIFRLTNSYGCPSFANTNKWYLVVNDLVKSAYEHGAITLQTNGEVQRDFIWMGDVCSVVEASLEFRESDTYNLSCGSSLRVLDIALYVQKVYEKRYQKPLSIHINTADKTAYQALHVDNAKLQSKMPFKAHNRLEEEIEKIFTLLEH